MTVDQFALVSSIFTLGGFLGALVSGPFCSNHGHRLSMQLMTISFLAGPICQSLAANLAVLVLGRFISGLGSGAAMVVVPIYIAEIAPPESKGLFGALTQITVNIGILVTQLLGYFLSHDSMWRIILVVPGILAIVQFIGLFFTPESPKWLAEHGHSKTARDILRKLRRYNVSLDTEADAWQVDGSNSDIGKSTPYFRPLPDSGVTFLSLLHGSPRWSWTTIANGSPAEEEALLRAPSSSEISAPHACVASVGILAAIRHPSYRPAIIAVIAVMVAQQLTGINSIVMYSVSLLSSLLPTSAALLSVAVSALNLIMTTACAPLSDRIGRKPCILLSTAGMGISSILLALGIGYSVKILGAIATLCFVASFAIGLGPVPFILSSELVNPEAVGAVQSWALAANWLATFAVSQFFPMVNALLGGNGRVYYIFAGFAALFGVFIAWWVPETKGKKGADEVWGREVEGEHQD